MVDLSEVIKKLMERATERLDGGFNLILMEDLITDLMDGGFHENKMEGFIAFIRDTFIGAKIV